MFKILFVVMLASAFVLLPALVSADTSRDVRTVEDILKGECEECPLLGSLYIAKTFKDVNIPIIGKTNWRTKLSVTSDINSIHSNNSMKIETGLEF